MTTKLRLAAWLLLVTACAAIVYGAIYTDTQYNRGCVWVSEFNITAPRLARLDYRHTYQPTATAGHPTAKEGDPIPLAHFDRGYSSVIPEITAVGCNTTHGNTVLPAVEILDSNHLVIEPLFVQVSESIGLRLEGLVNTHTDVGVKGFCQRIHAPFLSLQGNRQNLVMRAVKESDLRFYMEGGPRTREPNVVEWCYDCRLSGINPSECDAFTRAFCDLEGFPRPAGKLVESADAKPFVGMPEWGTVEGNREQTIVTKKFGPNCFVSIEPALDKAKIPAGGAVSATAEVEIELPDVAAVDRNVAFVRLTSDVNDAWQHVFIVPAGKKHLVARFRVLGGWTKAPEPTTWIPRLALFGTADCPTNAKITVRGLEVRLFQ